MVFLDLNGNGILDRGESGVGGIRLIAGDEMVETDDYGRYSVWNLAPFEPTDLQVDTSSLPNPLWIPVFELARAPISPNGFRRVDLPLIQGVELEGTVVTRDGNAVHRTASVPLELRQVGGRRHYATRTFHDGEFYLLGVVPGDYELAIDTSWLSAHGLSLSRRQTRRITILPGRDSFDLPIELEPASALRNAARPDRAKPPTARNH